MSRREANLYEGWSCSMSSSYSTSQNPGLLGCAVLKRSSSSEVCLRTAAEAVLGLRQVQWESLLGLRGFGMIFGVDHAALPTETENRQLHQQNQQTHHIRQYKRYVDMCGLNAPPGARCFLLVQRE